MIIQRNDTEVEYIDESVKYYTNKSQISYPIDKEMLAIDLGMDVKSQVIDGEEARVLVFEYDYLDCDMEHRQKEDYVYLDEWEPSTEDLYTFLEKKQKEIILRACLDIINSPHRMALDLDKNEVIAECKMLGATDDFIQEQMLAS